MNTIFKILTISIFGTMLLSCSEDDGGLSKAATIKVINLITGEGNVIVKTGNNSINYATTTNKVAWNEFMNFSIRAGVNSQIEVVPESDTLTPVFFESLNLQGIHSLYFSGTSDQVEAYLIEDTPKQFTDSLVGIRFVNVSKISGPLTINMAGSDDPIVSGLEQGSTSDFIEFPAKEADGSYTFEFRDISGNLLSYNSTFIVDPLDVANNNRDVSVKRNLTVVVYDFAFNPLFPPFTSVTRINSY